LNVIDPRSEWRNFANSDDSKGDPSRVGAASDPLLEGINMLDSTAISGMDGGSGKSRDLTKAQIKVVGRTEKHLLTAFKQIQAMCESIGLSKLVCDCAKQFFKKADDEKLLKGKGTEAVIAACIYIACREQRVTRTFKEICALTKVSKKDIGKCYKLLQPHFEAPVQSISLDVYVSRFSSALDLSPDVIRGTNVVIFSIINVIGS
jgi:transcription initiation factor TFIIB